MKNTEHKHSKLRFVTPEERYEGKDVAILAQRQRVLEQARERTPGRWGTRPVRNWIEEPAKTRQKLDDHRKC